MIPSSDIDGDFIKSSTLPRGWSGLDWIRSILTTVGKRLRLFRSNNGAIGACGRRGPFTRTAG
jgi:hypothetical protein